MKIPAFDNRTKNMDLCKNMNRLPNHTMIRTNLSQHGMGLVVDLPGPPAELHDGHQDGHRQAAEEDHEHTTNVHHIQS